MNSEEEIIEAAQGRTVGDLLKEERESRGLTVKQVSEATKIQARHIQAIEENDKDNMPSRVYAIGFVRTYSNYMGFEPEAMISLFKIKTVGRHDSRELDMTAEVDSQILATWPTLTAVSVLCLISMAVIWDVMSGGAGRRSFQVPPVPLELKAKVQEAENALEEFKATTEEPEAGLFPEIKNIPLDSEEPAGYVKQEETFTE